MPRRVRVRNVTGRGIAARAVGSPVLQPGEVREVNDGRAVRLLVDAGALTREEVVPEVAVEPPDDDTTPEEVTP